MKKKIMALLLSAAMVGSVGTLAACGGNDDKSDGDDMDLATAVATLKEGYFAFNWPADGLGTIYRFLHFYEDAGLGSIVYGGSQSGSYSPQGKITYYTVEEENFTYKVWDNREDAAKVHGDDVTDATIAEAEKTAISGTAPFTIKFKSVSDNTLVGKCGYDGKYLYTGFEGLEDPDNYMPQGSKIYTLRISHDTENSNTVAPYNKEQAQAVATYYQDKIHYIAINHDGTYTNSISADEVIVADGYKYTYANNVFTLKDAENNTLGTIDKSGSKILYKVSGKEDVELVTDLNPVLWKLTGKAANSQLNKDVDVELRLYQDLTCAVYVGDQQADKGTYTKANDLPATITLKTGGTLTVTNAENKLSVSLPAYSDSSVAACTVTFDLPESEPEPDETTIVKDLGDTGASANYGGYQYKLTINKDLTFEIKNSAGKAADGTWTYGSYVLTLNVKLYDENGAEASTTTVSTKTSDLAQGNFIITIDLGTGDSIFTFDAGLAQQLGDAVEANKPEETTIVKDLGDTGASANYGGYQYKLTINKDLTFEIKNSAGKAADGTWTYGSYVLTLNVKLYDENGAEASTTTVSTKTSDLAQGNFIITIDLGTGDSIFTFDAGLAQQLGDAVEANKPVVTNIVEDLGDTGASANYGGYQYKLTIKDDLSFEIKNSAGKAADGTWTYGSYVLTLNVKLYDENGAEASTTTVSTKTSDLAQGNFIITIDLGTGDSIFTFDAGLAQQLGDAVEANA